MRDHCSDGGALNTHAKDENKKGIQHDIDNGADDDGKHAFLAKSLGIDEAIHAKTKHDKNAAAQIDGKIIIGIGEGSVAGAK